MANIYEHKQDRLGDLLERASFEQGATILIPDLQRPFVWRPQQVTLLLDSLIRGWPFGTLLTWDVVDSDGAVMPCRPFWRLFDETEDVEADSEAVGQANPPAQFKMVLDGQQRIQSLLLALGGDGWGFRLDDRYWKESLEGLRPRGRRPTYPHWTKASLYFDIEAFFREYTERGYVMNIDYRKVLKWCAPAENDYSGFPRPENYERPVPLRRDLEPEGRRLVQLSRIWHATPANLNLPEAQLRSIIAARLVEEGFSEKWLEDKMQALGEFMVAMRSARLSEVAYLQVRAFDAQVWSPAQYNQAVVDIFTRLNTAGRTLTREEITFAWIKTGWEEGYVNGRRADKCFKNLLEWINEAEVMEISLDELVRVVSNLWALRHNHGVPLESSDLLEGEKVAPMAGDISREWNVIEDSIKACVEQMQYQDLQFGQNRWFNSLTSFSFVVAMHLRWQHGLAEISGEADRHNAEERFAAIMKHFTGRWLFNSTWSGVWADSSRDETRQLFTLLHEKLFPPTDADVLECLESTQAWMLSRVTNAAAETLERFEVSSPRSVSRYYPLLFLWTRLDEARWQHAGLPLRVASRRRSSLEVDHIVASSFWVEVINTARTNGQIGMDEERGLEGQINQIGNCMLLEKNFNISKSNRPLSDWLDEIDSMGDEVVRNEWLDSFHIDECMSGPANRSLTELVETFEARTEAIRKEMVEYVRGERERVDIG